MNTDERTLLPMHEQTLTEQKKTLESFLPDARKKARHAEEVLVTQGYRDYLDWVDRYTKRPLPLIQTPKDIFDILRTLLVNQGVKLGASYFEQVRKDQDILKQQIDELQEELHNDRLDELTETDNDLLDLF